MIETISSRFEIENIGRIETIYSLFTETERQNSNFKDLLSIYGNFFNLENLSQELDLWYSFKKQVGFDIKKIDPENRLVESKIFPTIFDLFRIYLTFPIANSESERSFSVLKRIKNCLRNRIEQDRLNELSLINIESLELKNLDVDKIIDIFARQKNRRIKFF